MDSAGPVRARPRSSRHRPTGCAAVDRRPRHAPRTALAQQAGASARGSPLNTHRVRPEARAVGQMRRRDRPPCHLDAADMGAVTEDGAPILGQLGRWRAPAVHAALRRPRRPRPRPARSAPARRANGRGAAHIGGVAPEKLRSRGIAELGGERAGQGFGPWCQGGIRAGVAQDLGRSAASESGRAACIIGASKARKAFGRGPRRRRKAAASDVPAKARTDRRRRCLRDRRRGRASLPSGHQCRASTVAVQRDVILQRAPAAAKRSSNTCRMVSTVGPASTGPAALGSRAHLAAGRGVRAPARSRQPRLRQAAARRQARPCRRRSHNPHLIRRSVFGAHVQEC
jgi:hypothetical protein